MESLEFSWSAMQQKHRFYEGVEIDIQGYLGEQLFINNRIANTHFSYFMKSKWLIYQDGKNILTNKGSDRFCAITKKIYPLTHYGDSINYDDGSIACMIEEKDLREILEKSFFLPDQLRFYDFIKDKLLLLKW